MASPRYWTDERDAILAANYQRHSSSWVGWDNLLPGSTAHSRSCRAHLIGCTRDTKNKESHTRWTEAEDELTLRLVVAVSKRTGRSPLAVARHAEYLVRNAKAIMRLREAKDGPR